MIATDQIRGPARRARLGRLTALRARRRGRRDAPGLRPLLPEPPSRPGGALPELPELVDLPDLVTPFVMETRAEALRAVGQLRSRLLRDSRAAIIGIHAESVRVVTQYDVRGTPSPAALARYGERVGAWRADAEVCRARAAALTHEANQRLACYWDAVWLTVRRARAEEARAERARAARERAEQARVRAEQARARTGAEEAPAPEGPVAAPDGPLPATDAPLPARPEHWLPGRVTLDDSWDDVDAWLFIGSVPAPAPPGPDRTPAVVRALQILDTQPARGGAPRAGDHHGRGTR